MKFGGIMIFCGAHLRREGDCEVHTTGQYLKTWLTYRATV